MTTAGGKIVEPAKLQSEIIERYCNERCQECFLTKLILNFLEYYNNFLPKVYNPQQVK